jgi:hypothetical protein
MRTGVIKMKDRHASAGGNSSCQLNCSPAPVTLVTKGEGVMTVSILCLVAFVFLAWVLMLEHKVRWLKKENQRLSAAVERQTQLLTGGVKAGEGRKLTRSEVEHAGRTAVAARAKR